VKAFVLTHHLGLGGESVAANYFSTFATGIWTLGIALSSLSNFIPVRMSLHVVNHRTLGIKKPVSFYSVNFLVTVTGMTKILIRHLLNYSPHGH
jgi:hypothetical protein